MIPEITVGNGWDIHPLVKGKHLVIGGVLMESDLGFAAHSDGDVLVHALVDALLGAAGLGDIGTWFPDSDAAFHKAYSLETFLPRVADTLKTKGFQVQHVDATVVLDQPKLAPYVPQIKNNLAETLRVAPRQVNIKAKRTEQCLFPAERPAGMAWVTVTLVKKGQD